MFLEQFCTRRLGTLAASLVSYTVQEDQVFCFSSVCISSNVDLHEGFYIIPQLLLLKIGISKAHQVLTSSQCHEHNLVWHIYAEPK